MVLIEKDGLPFLASIGISRLSLIRLKFSTSQIINKFERHGEL